MGRRRATAPLPVLPPAAGGGAEWPACVESDHARAALAWLVAQRGAAAGGSGGDKGSSSWQGRGRGRGAASLRARPVAGGHLTGCLLALFFVLAAELHSARPITSMQPTFREVLPCQAAKARKTQ